MKVSSVINTVDVYGDPPLTQAEVYELGEIHPKARGMFYKRVKIEWYMKIIITTVLLYGLEYAVFSFDVLWVYLIPLVPVFSLAHRLKYQRKTNYGALAAAKLEEPRNWPTWKRSANIAQQREKIRESNKTNYEKRVKCGQKHASSPPTGKCGEMNIGSNEDVG